MEDILDILTSRKSIRRYKPDPVPDEMIDKILEAARNILQGGNVTMPNLIFAAVLAILFASRSKYHQNLIINMVLP